MEFKQEDGSTIHSQQQEQRKSSRKKMPIHTYRKIGKAAYSFQDGRFQDGSKIHSQQQEQRKSSRKKFLVIRTEKMERLLSELLVLFIFLGPIELLPFSINSILFEKWILSMLSSHYHLFSMDACLFNV